jgi:sec-independent protein translocase protein TatC
MSEERNGGMPLLDHLRELRTRLIHSVVGVVVCTAVSIPFAEQILAVLMHPGCLARARRTEQPEGFLDFLLWTDPTRACDPAGLLIATGPPEAFLAKLKVGLAAAIVLSAPWLLFQIWRFVAPGLYAHEKKAATPVALWTSVAFLVGVAFAYFAVLPNAMYFFMGQASGGIESMWKVNEYLRFVTRIPIAFGIVFQLPLAMRFLARLGVVSAQRFAAGRPIAIPIIFMAAAILTPPDVFTQIMLGVPVVGLYELGIVLARRAGRQQEIAPTA